jgi:hypothetical protein
MDPVVQREPQSAADYDDRTTAAVKAVLLEIGQILGSFRGKFAVIGGAKCRQTRVAIRSISLSIS